MRIVHGFLLREVAGELIVIPTGEAARRLSGVITLNDCGRFLFERLQTEQTKESLVNALTEEYDIDERTASEDVDEFIDQLERYGFLM